MSRDGKFNNDGQPLVSAAQREAHKAFKAPDAEKALSEYEAAEKAFFKNRERLKAERLAREAEVKSKEE